MNYVILSTATIDPKGIPFSRRNNPLIRLKDYISTLKNIAGLLHYPIIFYENSGYDLTAIEGVLKKNFSQFEIIEDKNGQSFPRHLGKGYGELKSLITVVNKSKILTESNYIIKITGRYTFWNVSEIMNSLSLDFLVAAYDIDNIDENQKIYSGLFFCKPRFITEYLASYIKWVDDSKGHYMELALNKAIRDAKNKNEICVSYNIKPIVEGISGTWNAKYSKDDFKTINLSFGKIKMLFLSYFNKVINFIKNGKKY